MEQNLRNGRSCVIQVLNKYSEVRVLKHENHEMDEKASISNGWDKNYIRDMKPSA